PRSWIGSSGRTAVRGNAPVRSYDLKTSELVAGQDPEADEPKEEEVIAQRGLWRCAICTYDNDESMHVCDICGVIRHPVPGGNKTISNSTGTVSLFYPPLYISEEFVVHYGVLKIGLGGDQVPTYSDWLNRCVFVAVEGRCKEPMVSKLAKSLFESNSPKRGVLYQHEHKNLVLAQGALPRISRGNIHDLHKAFSSKNSSVSSIAPFKFDAPSPDDLVSNGLKSSRTGSKDSMKKKEKQDSAEQNPLKKGADRSETSFQGIQSFNSLPKAKADKSKETSSSSKNMEVSESLTGTMNNMSLAGETETSRDVKIRSARSKSNHKPEEWMMLDKESDTLSQLNLAIVGHVDSGKSTLSGRLLHLLGRISQKQMHKFEKEAKSQGKGSFAYAWALDESAEERERGITMTVAVAYFNSKRHHVVLLDSPGHKDFVPNMIAGATQADAAILVIDASIGAFEAGFDNLKGQTREHARVLRGFGVEQVIVAVNKMDIVGYSKERFELIKQHVGSFLHSCRFKESSLTWIPLSAVENQNLVASPLESRLSSWYRGPCLLEAVDSVKSPERDVSKPLLMPICDVVRSSSGQVSACGKLEAGAVRPGSKVHNNFKSKYFFFI
ncbi:hypothetical protein F2Q69_00018669, partial [Brassica cretica]